jgi:hypothetical protein
MDDRQDHSAENPTKSEIALHLGEFIASVMPVVGGPLGKTLSFVRESRDSRVRDLILDLDSRFKNLGNRLDHEFVASAEYADRWEATMDEAVRARNRDKRQFYLRALTVIAVKDRPKLDVWDFHVETLNRIDKSGLVVLAAATAERTNIIDTQAAWAYLRSQVTNMDDVTLARCWDDLSNLGLLSMRAVLVVEGQHGPVETEGLVTEYGQRFVNFLGLDHQTMKASPPVTFSDAD